MATPKNVKKILENLKKGSFSRELPARLVFLLIFLSIGSVYGTGYYNLLMFWKGIPAYTWIGRGADANWDNPLNWSTRVIPSISDTAIFDNNCVTNCSPTINTSISIRGILIKSTYGAFTISQGAGNTITIGSSGWLQSAGVFSGSGTNITVNGPVNMAGGTFNGGGSNLSFTSTVTVSGGTLNTGIGDTNITGALAVSLGTLATTTAIFNANSTFALSGTGIFSSTTGTKTFTGVSTISGGTFIGGSSSSNFNAAYNQSAGAVTLGTGTNTFAAAVTASGGTLTCTTGTQNFSNSLTANGGTVNFGSSTVNVAGTLSFSAGSFTSTSGNLNLAGGLSFSGAPTFNANSGTVVLVGSTQALTPGTRIFNNVTFRFENGSGVNTAGTKNLTGTWTIAGNLSLAAYAGCGASCLINGGTLSVSGNLSTTNDGSRGTAAITLTGASNTTVSAVSAGTLPAGTFTVNKSSTSTTVTLLGTVNVGTAGQNFTITQGTVQIGTNVLDISATLNVSVNGILTCTTGGDFNYGTLVHSGVISCDSYPYNWVGTSGDGKWSTGANWSGGSPPGVGNIAYFNNSFCVPNCNVTIDVNVTSGIRSVAGYTGTISQGATTTINTGTNDFRWASGTFVGSGADITVVAGNSFSLTGGTFTSTSGNLNLTSGLNVSGSPTFSANGGTVRFTATQTITPSTLQFNNVTFAGNGATFTISGTMTVNGNLLLGDSNVASGTMTGGIISASGNVTVDNNGYRGTTQIRIAGSSGTQTIANSTNTYFPNLHINTSGSSVVMSGTFRFQNGLTYSAGSLTTSAASFIFDATQTISIASAVNFQNVQFVGTNRTYTLSGAASFSVLGTLTLGDLGTTGAINGNSINARGNLTFTGNGFLGTTILIVNGSANQTVTSVAAARIPAFQINSTGGTVTLSGTLRFNGNFTYTAGAISASGSTLNFVNTSTVTSTAVSTWGNVTFSGAGATFTLSGTMVVGGTLTLGDTGSGFINTGTLEAKGNVVANNNGYGGTASINVSGNSNQTISGISTAFIPRLQIISTGGTVTYSGTLRPFANYTVTSGTVDASSATMRFQRTSTITPGAVAYNDVTFASTGATFTLSGTLTVNGLLTAGDTTGGNINGGSIVANGNVSYNNSGYLGTTTMTFGGTSAATLTSSTTNLLRGNVTVNKTAGGTLTLANNIDFSGAGQTLTVTSGSILMSGRDLTVQSSLFLNPGTTVNRGGGVLTANGSTVNAGTCCGGGTVL
jgi:fibronectin-binding autotransporter adhesin